MTDAPDRSGQETGLPRLWAKPNYGERFLAVRTKCRGRVRGTGEDTRRFIGGFSKRHQARIAEAAFIGSLDIVPGEIDR